MNKPSFKDFVKHLQVRRRLVRELNNNKNDRMSSDKIVSVALQMLEYDAVMGPSVVTSSSGRCLMTRYNHGRVINGYISHMNKTLDLVKKVKPGDSKTFSKFYDFVRFGDKNFNSPFQDGCFDNLSLPEEVEEVLDPDPHHRKIGYGNWSLPGFKPLNRGRELFKVGTVLLVSGLFTVAMSSLLVMTGPWLLLAWVLGLGLPTAALVDIRKPEWDIGVGNLRTVEGKVFTTVPAVYALLYCYARGMVKSNSVAFNTSTQQFLQGTIVTLPVEDPSINFSAFFAELLERGVIITDHYGNVLGDQDGMTIVSVRKDQAPSLICWDDTSDNQKTLFVPLEWLLGENTYKASVSLFEEAYGYKITEDRLLPSDLITAFEDALNEEVDFGSF